MIRNTNISKNKIRFIKWIQWIEWKSNKKEEGFK